MSELRADVIAAKSRDADVVFVKFARGAKCTREEARLAMVAAIIGDTAEADLPTLLANIEMLIAAAPEGRRRAGELIGNRN